MAFTEVLFCTTEDFDCRSEIMGWTAESGKLYVPGKPIGLSPSPHSSGIRDYCPATILEALSYGWELVGPPQKDPETGWYDWCLQRKR
jgi:hypothetical protein